jgi:hypothetical protein
MESNPLILETLQSIERRLKDISTNLEWIRMGLFMGLVYAVMKIEHLDWRDWWVVPVILAVWLVVLVGRSIYESRKPKLQPDLN